MVTWSGQGGFCVWLTFRLAVNKKRQKNYEIWHSTCGTRGYYVMLRVFRYAASDSMSVAPNYVALSANRHSEQKHLPLLVVILIPYYRRSKPCLGFVGLQSHGGAHGNNDAESASKGLDERRGVGGVVARAARLSGVVVLAGLGGGVSLCVRVCLHGRGGRGCGCVRRGHGVSTRGCGDGERPCDHRRRGTGYPFGPC
jgi:hypothetical protein